MHTPAKTSVPVRREAQAAGQGQAQAQASGQGSPQQPLHHSQTATQTSQSQAEGTGPGTATGGSGADGGGQQQPAQAGQQAQQAQQAQAQQGQQAGQAQQRQAQQGQAQAVQAQAAEPVDDGPDYSDDGRGGLWVEADPRVSGDAADDYDQQGPEELGAEGQETTQAQAQQGTTGQGQGQAVQGQGQQGAAGQAAQAGTQQGTEQQAGTQQQGQQGRKQEGQAAQAAQGAVAGRADDGGAEGEADGGPDYQDDGSTALETEVEEGMSAGGDTRGDDYELKQEEQEEEGKAKAEGQQGQAQAQGQQEKEQAQGGKGGQQQQPAAQQQAAQQQAGTKTAASNGAGTLAPLDDTAAADAADPWVNTTAGCAPLSAQLLSRWAVNGTVLVALTNSVMFHNFGDTWLHHVRKAGITYWVLAVADNHTAHLVRSRGAHQCFLVKENEIDNTNATFKWGSRSWQLTTWQKVLVVRHVHHLGFHVINSDMDVVWMRNPLHHFLVKYPHPDYWVSMDPITTRNPLGDDGPELGVGVHHYMNTGVYFLRQTPGGRALIDKWYEIRGTMQGRGYHDQDGLYNYLNKLPEQINSTARVARVLDGATALAQLPATLFQNGYSHCINQIHKVHGLDPFEVHFVWVWGGNLGKMTRMREQRYYIDPPSYYEDPYLLSYDVLPIQDPVGYNDWNDTEAMVMTHLNAVESQLTDSWHGFALAALLGRTVILPKMKCYCIQNWFENPQCRLPGEPLTRFPLSPACPADFVFNMDALGSLNVSGRAVGFREFSFLDNERTPAEVRLRPLTVTAKPGIASASRDGDALTIPVGLASDQLMALLRPHLGSPAATAAGGAAAAGATSAAAAGAATPPPPRRVHFTNPRLAFGGWSDPRVGAAYEAAVAGLGVKWCCRPESVAKTAGKPLHHQLMLRRAPAA